MRLEILSNVIGGKSCFYIALNRSPLTVLDIRKLFSVSCEDIYMMYRDERFIDAGSYYYSTDRKLVEVTLGKLPKYNIR